MIARDVVEALSPALSRVSELRCAIRATIDLAALTAKRPPPVRGAAPARSGRW